MVNTLGGEAGISSVLDVVLVRRGLAGRQPALAAVTAPGR